MIRDTVSRCLLGGSSVALQGVPLLLHLLHLFCRTHSGPVRLEWAIYTILSVCHPFRVQGKLTLAFEVQPLLQGQLANHKSS